MSPKRRRILRDGDEGNIEEQPALEKTKRAKKTKSKNLPEVDTTDVVGPINLPQSNDAATDSSTSAALEDAANGGAQQYFLMKSEPESRLENGVEMKFGIQDLAALPNQTTQWDGVRNAAARNTMRKMKVGDLAFFYHSNCKTPAYVEALCLLALKASLES